MVNGKVVYIREEVWGRFQLKIMTGLNSLGKRRDSWTIY
jgi:hypothetical protein